MTKKKSHTGYENDAEQPADVEDPKAKHEYTVLTDGAIFHKDHFKMKKADVPPPEEKEGDHVTCGIGDVVALTKEEAYAVRSSGVALAERPEPAGRPSAEERRQYE
jgi:hypothetical protein